jgi:bifunctional non-homologous end joining protein LigD
MLKASNQRLIAGTKRESQTLIQNGAHPSQFPKSVHPQLALKVNEPPNGQGWLHEIKYDGYRMLCYIHGGKARFVSRNELDWSHRWPKLVKAALELNIGEAILDGEIAVLNPDGTTSFQRLQNAMTGGPRVNVVYFAFDLLYLAGYDLRNVPLIERKALLEKLLPGSSGLIRYSGHYEGEGKEFYEQACKHGLEGIISKRSQGRYKTGRSADWQKVKCVRAQEFVIAGFTEPGTRTRNDIGALLVGCYDRQGKLTFCGKVGTGFGTKARAMLRQKLEGLETSKPAFTNPPFWSKKMIIHWVKPTLVAHVAFTEWTDEGVLRHPSFKGLREDKKATEVIREVDARQS